jgi:hypothetical protein
VPDTLEPELMYKQIPFDDPSAVVDAVLEIDQGDETILDMRSNAWKRVKSTMSSRVYQEALLKFYATALGKESRELGEISDNAKRAKRLRRKWRAWDRTHWAKELWVAGAKQRAVQYILEAIMIDPLSEGLWRVPARKLGFGRDER